MTVKAVLWKYKARRDGTHNIKIYVHDQTNGKRYEATEFYALPADWDEAAGMLKKTHPLAIHINGRIKARILELSAAIASGGKSQGLLDFVEKYIEEVEAGIHSISAGTLKIYRNNLGKLRRYCEERRLKEIEWHTINMDFYTQYSEFLSRSGCNGPGIGNHIKAVKKFMGAALERGLHTNTAHKAKAFRANKEVVGEKIYLTEDEIRKLHELDLSGRPDLARERDRFLVAYYLILRHSDSVTIREDKFFLKDGRRFYQNEAQKTGTHNYVPVKQWVWETLQRYKFDLASDTNQEANRKLKTIGAMAGITTPVGGQPKWAHLTTHTARRSAATNLLLSGMSIEVIAQLGGWKNRQALQKYLLAGGIELAQLAAENPFFD